ncbi:MAG: ATP-binding protein [Candidatus Ornithospirochaeta sp.]
MKDNGPGISKSEIKRVTEKGYVGEKWRGKNSNGMGLYIVKETAKNLSIDFEIFSEEGKETSFVFHFPRSL